MQSGGGGSCHCWPARYRDKISQASQATGPSASLSARVHRHPSPSASWPPARQENVPRGISCQYREPQLTQLSSADVWPAFERFATHSFKCLKCIFIFGFNTLHCDESFYVAEGSFSHWEKINLPPSTFTQLYTDYLRGSGERAGCWNRDREQSHQWPQSAVWFLGTVGAERVWCRQSQQHD